MVLCKRIRFFKYQLLEHYTIKTPIKHKVVHPYIRISEDGELTIKKNYAWDGPSGPTFDTKTFMRGALVHDALYQLIREGHIDKKYKADADNLLKAICIEDGMSRIRAWYVYQAVRVFGHRGVVTKKIKIAN